MLSRWPAVIFLAFSLLTCASHEKQVDRNHKYARDFADHRRNLHMANLKPPVNDLNMTNPARSTKNSSTSTTEAEKRDDPAKEIPSDDLMRGRGSMTSAEAEAYAKIQPKKSLIGATIAFLVYLFGTMLYNYIVKMLEKERVAKAMRDYEEEREHYIETGETIDIPGAER